TDFPPTSPYSLPLHDALPIFLSRGPRRSRIVPGMKTARQLGRLGFLCAAEQRETRDDGAGRLELLAVPRSDRDPVSPLLFGAVRSEEHTSELQSRENLVCRLL